MACRPVRVQTGGCKDVSWTCAKDATCLFNIMGIHHMMAFHHMMGFHHMMDIYHFILQILPKAEHCTALISHRYSSVCHRRNISPFFRCIIIWPIQTIYFLKAHDSHYPPELRNVSSFTEITSVKPNLPPRN